VRPAASPSRPSAGRRAAASSIASAIPSSSRHSSATGHHEPGAAGRQHRQARAAGQQALDGRGHPLAQVLAVVQHQQGMAIRQGGQDRLVHPAALLLTDPRAAATAAPTIAGSVISAADSRMRPMNGVNGEGSLATAAPDRSASASPAASWARPRRSGTPSLRSSEETCVSTVRDTVPFSRKCPAADTLAAPCRDGCRNPWRVPWWARMRRRPSRATLIPPGST
jgi:hypothetical protein